MALVPSKPVGAAFPETPISRFKPRDTLDPGWDPSAVSSVFLRPARRACHTPWIPYGEVSSDIRGRTGHSPWVARFRIEGRTQTA